MPMRGKKVAFLDCKCGVAGDMLLGALLDAGAPRDQLVAGLKTILPLAEEWNLDVQNVVRSKGHIAATYIKVCSIYGHEEVSSGGSARTADAENLHQHSHNHDHEHKHTHAHLDSHEGGETHSHPHSHPHSHAHGHVHTHTPDHSGADHPHAALAGRCTRTHDDHSHYHTHAHGDIVHDHHHQHNGPLRNLDVIRDMIEAAEGLPESVRVQSIAVFTALAEAEAATHGVGIDEIHFHEVGAVDSIIDTVGSVFALHLLGVEEVYSSALPFGEGFTGETAHGILAVPTPATLRLMLGLPTTPGPKGAMGELVTPTGASLIKVLAEGRVGQPPIFVPELLGIGAGTKDFPGHANVVRVVIGRRLEEGEEGREGEVVRRASFDAGGEEDGMVPRTRRQQQHPQSPLRYLSEKGEPSHPITRPPALHPPTTHTTHTHAIPPSSGSAWSSGGWEERHLCELEANLDDMTPETASFALERLMSEPGCLDVWYTPAVMKKGRPGLTLHLLCEPATAPALLRCMFLETPTLGVRAHTVARLALERDFVMVPTRYGEVRAKIGRMDGVVVNVKPEYEDCRGAAMALGLPLRVVAEEAARVARGQMDDEGGKEGGKEGRIEEEGQGEKGK
ncbi:rrna methyltransferase [Nannochloropsis oceanica]